MKGKIVTQVIIKKIKQGVSNMGVLPPLEGEAIFDWQGVLI